MKLSRQMAISLEIRRLGERDICAGFSAGTGQEKLDDFFRRYAKQHNRRGTSATYVAIAEGKIVGFVTIVPGVVTPERIDDLVSGLSRNYPAPVLILARMATDFTAQRQGIGSRLVIDLVLTQAVKLSEGFGCVGIYVDAKPESVAFYDTFGFLRLVSDAASVQIPMFLPIATARKILKEATEI
jgi:GNAT superfamily N-acetyltransferase